MPVLWTRWGSAEVGDNRTGESEFSASPSVAFFDALRGALRRTRGEALRKPSLLLLVQVRRLKFYIYFIRMRALGIGPALGLWGSH